MMRRICSGSAGARTRTGEMGLGWRGRILFGRPADRTMISPGEI